MIMVHVSVVIYIYYILHNFDLTVYCWDPDVFFQVATTFHRKMYSCFVLVFVPPEV